MKFRNRLRYTKKNDKENSLSVRPEKPFSKGISSAILYHSCNKVDLETFLDCLYENDFSGLVIDGQPTEEEIKSAWQKIYLEYCTLIQDGQYNEVFELTKDINTTNAKITLVDGIVKHLVVGFDQELVTVLNAFSLRCDLREEDYPDAVIKKLNGVISRAKKWLIGLELNEQKLSLIQSENTEKTTRDYFDDMMLLINKYNGYHVRKTELTVTEFCKTIKKLNEQYTRELGFKNK
jgi:hypothetical protein